MNAEVPGAIAVWADPTNYRPRPQAQEKAGYSLVIIHITSGRADPMGPARMWQEPWHGTSAHFVVGQDGTVIQCVPLKFAAQHAHSCNPYAVGIEHCAREPKELSASDPGLPPSDALYRASAKLVAYLLKAAGLPVTRQFVKGHAEADNRTTHTGCPDSVWQWDIYMPLVQAEFGKL